MSLQFSQSIVQTLILGDWGKNLFMIIGETAPGKDRPVLPLSTLDLPLLLVLGLLIDISMESFRPLLGYIKQRELQYDTTISKIGFLFDGCCYLK